MPISKADSAAREPGVSVALIVPDDERRRAIGRTVTGADGRIIREFSDYPNENMLSKVVEAGCDVVVVDLQSDVEPGLGLVENFCRRHPAVTVMACSTRNEADVVIRAMQAGAREFLTFPPAAEVILQAFTRAHARRQIAAVPARGPGKVLVFQGTKGGVGVTTLATNFAVSLMKESEGEIVLVDLHPQLGEVALGLGLVPQFSVADAMGNAGRLDSDFLSTLLIKHSSGLMVLASSDVYGTHRSLERGAEKLLRILREQFAFVVVDAGSCSGNIPDALFDMADTVYLVTEATLPALRNARRLISWFTAKQTNLEVVLNRYNSRMVEIDEESTMKALSRAVDWKIPNDYTAVRGAQNLGITLMDQKTPISRALSEMAKAARGPVANARERTILPVEVKGEKWKFWTSNNTKPAFTARF